MRFPTKPLTAEEETLRLRERALRDEVSLLKEAKREGRVEGEQIGIQKGRVEGESLLLRKMIKMKFGDLPHWADELISAADSQQIDAWAELLMSANSIEALLGKH